MMATDTWLPKSPCPYCSILAGRREPLATLWGTSTCSVCVHTIQGELAAVVYDQEN